MTEAYEDGNYLVRVRAQVMTRDDSSGGWVPLGGGGLSNVSVRKRVTASSISSSAPNNQNTCLVKNNGDRKHSSINGERISLSRNSDRATKTTEDSSRHSSVGDNTDIHSIGGQPAMTKHEYFIYGKRISDQSIVLCCTIKKDFEYNKVMPTFHHWRTEDKKFGLTFQTAADARAFDKGVRMAVEDLLDGLVDTYPSSLYKYSKEKDLGDDDVFMTLNLPIETPLSETKGSNEGSGSITRYGMSQHGGISTLSGSSISATSEQIHRIHYPSCRDLSSPISKEPKGDNYSYVQLTAVHEYIYPVVEESKAATRQDLSLKKRNLEVIPPPSHGSKSKHKKSPKYISLRCQHCNEDFIEEDNKRGSCEYAPDSIKTGIERITCIACARCMLYHCMSDAEGDFNVHPCDCSRTDQNCGKRWVGITLLSLFVPCLWFYPLLRACHACGVSCGICGGRHSSN